VPANREIGCVIEGSALEAAVVEQKPAGLDQIDFDPKASGQPQQGTGILRNVRLEQSDAQSASKAGFSGSVERHYTRVGLYSPCRRFMRQSVT
jgi:hypothetical protein